MIEPTTKATSPPIPSAPETRHKRLAHHEGNAEQDQSQAGVADGQHLKRVEREQQTNAADHAWQHIARVPELEEQAVDAEQHQDIGDVGVGDDREQTVAPVGLVGLEREIFGIELHLAALELHFPAVEFFQKLRQVGSHEVGDVGLHRLLGRNRRRLAHCLLGPSNVAPAQLREASYVSDGVVQRLLVHARLLGFGFFLLALGVFFLFFLLRRGRFVGPAGIGHAADTHRRGRADVGRRRHRRNVRREQDVGAGGCGARARGRHVHHHRHGRGEDVLDDDAHGGVEPAGGIHLQDHERGVGILGLGEPAVHVIRGRRTDSTADLHKNRLPWHSRFLGRYRRPALHGTRPPLAVGANRNGGQATNKSSRGRIRRLM